MKRETKLFDYNYEIGCKTFYLADNLGDDILSLESLLNDPDYQFFHNVIKDRISQILRDKGARA